MRTPGQIAEADYRRRLALWLAMAFAVVMYLVAIQRVTPSIALVAASFVVKRKAAADILALAL